MFPTEVLLVRLLGLYTTEVAWPKSLHQQISPKHRARSFAQTGVPAKPVLLCGVEERGSGMTGLHSVAVRYPLKSGVNTRSPVGVPS